MYTIRRIIDFFASIFDASASTLLFVLPAIVFAFFAKFLDSTILPGAFLVTNSIVGVLALILFISLLFIRLRDGAESYHSGIPTIFSLVQFSRNNPATYHEIPIYNASVTSNSLAAFPQDSASRFDMMNEAHDVNPIANLDGTPMVEGGIDSHGKPFGVY